MSEPRINGLRSIELGVHDLQKSAEFYRRVWALEDVSGEGDTLHLHFAPGEQYATGDFGYYLIARGYKHGLRVVGTIKAEPDMNVLAIYEK